MHLRLSRSRGHDAEVAVQYCSLRGVSARSVRTTDRHVEAEQRDDVEHAEYRYWREQQLGADDEGQAIQPEVCRVSSARRGGARTGDVDVLAERGEVERVADPETYPDLPRDDRR